MRKVYKYATGDKIPDGAVYLTTVIQQVYEPIPEKFSKVERAVPQLVWHYFLVLVDN